MFADKLLAKKIESAIAHNHKLYTEHCISKNLETNVAFLDVLGGVACYINENDPLSQAIGIGLKDNVSKEDFDQLENFYREKNATCAIELCPLVHPDLLYWLNVRNYTVIEFSNMMFLDLTRPIKLLSSSAEIIVSETEDYDLFSSVVALGFSEKENPMSRAISRFIRTYAELNHVKCFIAKIDRVAVGGASIAINSNGVADLALTSTLADYRGRGIQRALIYYRLMYALEQNASLAVATFSPGSISQRNFERYKFRLAYTRAKFEKKV